jgi:hypothetical protein
VSVSVDAGVIVETVSGSVSPTATDVSATERFGELTVVGADDLFGMTLLAALHVLQA